MNFMAKRKSNVYLYRNRPSAGIRKLARKLGCSTNLLRGSRQGYRRSPVVVNWGTTDRGIFSEEQVVLNEPGKVDDSCDKEKFLRACDEAGGIRIPPILSLEEAEDRIKKGRRVVGRSLLRGSGGRGIQVFREGDDLTGNIDGKRIKLYTSYIPKRDEYRVHCFRDIGVVDVQHKRRVRGNDERDNEIRNHKNGWVYCREDIRYPSPEVLKQAWAAFGVSSLDFGAVDVIWNEGAEKAWVLEINTAPGLEGETLEIYSKALRKIINARCPKLDKSV
jgi:glutathione synthase/RimK-type ligase-like ATP-grasp enzyme